MISILKKFCSSTYIIRIYRAARGAASVQVLNACTRKCQAIAKQPCIVAERATENDGCNFSVGEEWVS